MSGQQHKIERFKVFLTNHFVSRIIFSRLRLAWYRRVLRLQIGKQSSVLTDFKVASIANVVIGNNTVINNSCRFDNRGRITIGNNVSITYGTHIYTKGHDPDSPLFKTKAAPVTIEDYVWVCANAIILPGVTLGKGCVVLPGAVVTKSVPPFHIVGGNPARFIRERNNDLRYTLNFDPWVPFFG